MGGRFQPEWVAGLVQNTRQVWAGLYTVGLTALPGNEQVTLYWDQNLESDLHMYNIYRETSSPAGTLIDSVVATSPSDTSYADTTVFNGETYYYRITAVDSAGNESAFSDESYATPNAPPVWTGIPDTSFYEDDSLIIDIDAYVSDDSDPNSTLTLDVSGGIKISTRIDANIHLLTLTAAPDSSGFSEQLIVTATDPWNASSRDTFSVAVIPMNDAPRAFKLIEPQDSTQVVITPDNVGETLTFSWETSTDIDGETLFYSLVGTHDLLFLSAEFQEENFLEWTYADLAAAIDSIDVATGTWTVFVTDGVDTVLATDGSFFLTLVASSLSVVNTALIPERFALHQNYPNPFNPITTLRYDLPERGKVLLTIYDILGRHVRSLVNGVEEPGFKKVVWNGTNDLGEPVSSGVYLYRVQAGDFSQTSKMILVK